jgi:hypothetical protein
LFVVVSTDGTSPIGLVNAAIAGDPYRIASYQINAKNGI